MNIIYPKIYTNITYSSQKHQSNQPSFSASTRKFEQVMKYLQNYQGNPTYKYNIEAGNIPPDIFDGIQHDLPIFKGRHIDAIMKVFSKLSGILLSRGCSNQCGHCLANALPHSYYEPKYVHSMPWEDFAGIIDGIKKLSDRFKISVLKLSDRSDYVNNFRQPMYLFLDADCMDIVLRDKEGKPHEFPEIVKKLYESTGKTTIFDTGSWNYKSKPIQERAERYVEFFANPDSKKMLKQVNISMNPFHSIYMKSLELGYSPVSDVCNDIRAQKGKKIYQEYLNRMANMLVTFSPLKNKPNFGIILRVLDDKVPNMEGFRVSEFKKVQKDILKRMEEMLQNDLKANKKYVNCMKDIKDIVFFYSQELKDFSTDIIFVGRFENLFRKRNPDITEEKIKKLFSNNLVPIHSGFYIDANGDVFMVKDSKLYSRFPMFNTSNKNIPTLPLRIKPYNKANSKL